MVATTCQGKTKNGDACNAPALPNSDFCRHHQPAEPEPGAVCGHHNRHHRGNETLTCDLPPGHSGDHSAVFYATDYKEGAQIVFQGEKRTYWNDAAGVPVGE